MLGPARACSPACLFRRIRSTGIAGTQPQTDDMCRKLLRAFAQFFRVSFEVSSSYLDDAFERSALPLRGESPPPSAVDREGLLDGAGGSPVIPHVLCRALRTLCEGTFSHWCVRCCRKSHSRDERQDASAVRQNRGLKDVSSKFHRS